MPKLPYALDSTLKPNKSYSTLGITLKIPQEQETFNNEGNFTIYLNNIDLSTIQNQSKNTITQDSPIFCYIQESKQIFIAKLQENQTIIKCEINKNLSKDERGNRELINPKLIFLSFVPFQSNFKANNTTSQKLQLTSEDLDRGSITKDFVIPHKSLRDCERFREWEGENDRIPILSKKQDRKQSIINNTPAIFNIEGYENDSSDEIPWYQWHRQEEVTENSKTIDDIVGKNIHTNIINHNKLIRAIIYLETTHGYYDAFMPYNKTFRPMNVNYDYWKEWIDKMGYTKEQVKNDKTINIIVGYELLKRIIDRLENPTIEKIGTIYNALAKEKISSYGRILKYYYDNESWVKSKTSSAKGY